MTSYEPPLQQFELAELFRLAYPGARYLGDKPEKWTVQTLLHQLRVRLSEARGGTRVEMGEAIRLADEKLELASGYVGRHESGTGWPERAS